jgi:GntR family transcriptional regulator/MocR family aminotransferase
MRRIYEQRRNELLAGLSRHCASSLEPIVSDAGLHLAARLKSPVNLPALQRCLRETAPGARALQEYAQEPSMGDGIAFGFGQIDGSDMDLALHRLGRGLMKLR